MVKIRLSRQGSKGAPFYRIVVSDSRNARGGEAIARLGYYNPMTEPAEVKLDVDAAKEWIAKGAQPTEAVKRLIKKAEE